MTKNEFRSELISDPLLFTKYFFETYYQREFYVGEHHVIISEILKKILSLEITRLVLNMPPRFGKTEMVVKMLCSMGFAFNPKCNFIHVSSSDKLALDNSDQIRNIIKSQPYQDLWNIKTKTDTDSKSMWYTEDGGGMIASSSGGQITGFGAGSIDSNYFSGAMIFDDSMKPEDAMSIIKRDAINRRYDSTVRTRLNSEKTPIIILGHRLHKMDLSGYVLSKSGEWTHITLPALKEDGTALWDKKLNIDELNHLRKVSYYVFQTQYQQQIGDIKVGGEFLKEFDVNKHVKDVTYTQDMPIHISVDNNVLPYITVSLWQKTETEIRQFHELPCRDPDNTATKSGQKVAMYLKSLGYDDMLFVHGDSTGKNQSTVDDEKRSFFQKFMQLIEEQGFKVRDKVNRVNPPVAISGQFVNSVFAGAYDCEILVDKSCHVSIDDYINTKEDEQGGVLKKRITDSMTKQTFEEYGHFTDALRYVIVDFLNSEFLTYRSGDKFYDYSIGKRKSHR